MTKTLIPAVALIAVAASPVLADTLVQDTDENGSFSLEELVVAYPDLTEALFGEIDADASGEVTVEELTAAIDAGLISG
jgi:hypothetical protein